MHHLTKKSLLKKYAVMVDEGKSAIEIKNTIVINEADKALTVEDIDELALSLFEEPKENAATAIVGEGESKELKIDSEGNVVLSEESPNVPKGKKLYDIYHGQWWPIEVVTGYDGKDHVITWEFRPEGKPKVTNVPCEQHRAVEFNAGRRLRAAKTPTEQMIPVDAIDKKVIDKLPNPNEARRIN